MEECNSPVPDLGNLCFHKDDSPITHLQRKESSLKCENEKTTTYDDCLDILDGILVKIFPIRHTRTETSTPEDTVTTNTSQLAGLEICNYDYCLSIIDDILEGVVPCGLTVDEIIELHKKDKIVARKPRIRSRREYIVMNNPERCLWQSHLHDLDVNRERSAWENFRLLYCPYGGDWRACLDEWYFERLSEDCLGCCAYYCIYCVCFPCLHYYRYYFEKAPRDDSFLQECMNNIYRVRQEQLQEMVAQWEKERLENVQNNV